MRKLYGTAATGFVVGDKVGHDTVMADTGRRIRGYRIFVVLCDKCKTTADIPADVLWQKKRHGHVRRCKGCFAKQATNVGRWTLTAEQCQAVKAAIRPIVYKMLGARAETHFDDIFSDTVFRIMVSSEPCEDICGLAHYLAKSVTLKIVDRACNRFPHTSTVREKSDEGGYQLIDIFETMSKDTKHDTAKIEKQSELFNSLSERDRKFMSWYVGMGGPEKTVRGHARFQKLADELRQKFEQWEAHRIL